MTHQTENGFTRIADSLLLGIAASDLSKREHQILLVVIAYTYGFHRTHHLLTAGFLAAATGLTRANAARTVAGMVQRGILTSNRTQHGNVIGIRKAYFPVVEGAAKTGTTDVPKTGTKVLPKQAHKKENSIDKPTETPLPPTLDPQVWQEFLTHRKEKRSTMTATAQRRALLMLGRQADPTACVVQSLEAGWTGIFELKNRSNGNGTGHRTAAQQRQDYWDGQAALAGFGPGAGGQGDGVAVDVHGRPVRDGEVE